MPIRLQVLGGLHAFRDDVPLAWVPAQHISSALLVYLALEPAVTRAQLARVLAENVVDTVRQPLLVMDGSLRVVRANPSFYAMFATAPDLVEGRLIYDVAADPWRMPTLRALLERVLSQGESFDGFEAECDLPAGGRTRLLLGARPVATRSAEPAELILLAIDDGSASVRPAPSAGTR